jgi:CRISPR-associated endonuclease Cas2
MIRNNRTVEFSTPGIQFAVALLEEGFTMTQYSVYTRHCANADNAQVHVRRMGDQVPAEGEVRFLTITDRQFWTNQGFCREKTPAKRPFTLPAGAFLRCQEGERAFASVSWVRWL